MWCTNIEEKALLECYRRMYKRSDPPADFDKLMKESKEIPFLDYEIHEEAFYFIIDEVLLEFGLFKNKEYRKKMFINTLLLGCSPKFKKK